MRGLLGLALALLPVALLGCTYPEGGGVEGGVAPRITSSFPESGQQLLVVDGSLTFEAAGEDADSLSLTWEWRLDDEVEVLSSSEDGAFDQAWTLAWDPDLSGASVDVTFEVSDGAYSAELFWPVDVD